MVFSFIISIYFPLQFIDLQIYNLYTMSVYNLQGFEAKNLSTNLQEFLKIIVDSTINIGSNLRSTFNCPPPFRIRLFQLLYSHLDS